AKSAAEVVWQRGLLRKGVGLCHGISGNAFAFLALYKHTKNPIDYDRAYKFFKLCLNFEALKECDGRSSNEDTAAARIPISAALADPKKEAKEHERAKEGLFEGAAGVAWLACELGFWGMSGEATHDGHVECGPNGGFGFPCFTDLF
ncbi:hypothetical protein HDU76_004778, partial [Blyttiomyces sp. JEL0837]